MAPANLPPPPFPHLKVLDFQRSRFHSVLLEELSQLTDKGPQ